MYLHTTHAVNTEEGSARKISPGMGLRMAHAMNGSGYEI